MTVSGTGSYSVDDRFIFVGNYSGGASGTATITGSGGGLTDLIEVVAVGTGSGTGVLTLTGGPSAVDISVGDISNGNDIGQLYAPINVGVNGIGEILIESGATLVSTNQGYYDPGLMYSVGSYGNVSIGRGYGAVGIVTVDGDDSFLGAYGLAPRITVGRDSGTGTLNITDGGEVGSLSIIAGRDGDSIGTINVDGAGSTLTASDTFGQYSSYAGNDYSANGASVRIGRANSDGYLNVTNGGVVDIENTPGVTFDARLRVGEGQNAQGAVLVSGAGSEINVSGFARIGREGVGTVDIENGGRLIVTNNAGIDPVSGNTDGGYYNVNIGRNGGDGTVTVSGNGSFLGTYGMASRVTVGRDYGSLGTLNVEDGGDVGTLSLVIGRNEGTGIVNVDGAGSTISVNDAYGTYGAYNGTNFSALAGGISVGRQGAINAELNITGGGAVDVFNTQGVTDDPYINVGRDAGSSGLVLVSGAGSQLNITQNGGTPDNSNPGAVVSANAFLGIGRNGQGTVTVENSGEVNVTGTNASVSLGDQRGTGTPDGSESLLEIRGGGVVNVTGDVNSSVRVADSAGTAARLIIEGGGSQLNISNAPGPNPDTFAAALIVGREGTGIAEVTNGGTVTIDGSDTQFPALIIGGRTANDPSDGTGTLTVDGAGSSITVTGANTDELGSNGFMSVGRSENSSGTVSITNGGVISLEGSTAATEIAGTPGSSGSVSIDGTGSRLDAGTVLLIGADTDEDSTPTPAVGGDGSVTVSNNGILEADDILVGLSGLLDADASIIGNVTIYGAFEIAGNGVGAASVDGDFLTEITSTVSADITDFSGGVGDSMTLTGIGNFDEGFLDLNVSNALSIADGETYTLATSSTGIVLSTYIVTDQATGRAFELSAIGNSVVLTALQFDTDVTPGNDILAGSQFANTINLLSGDDVYSGLGGNDTVDGGGGNDGIYLGAGADIAFGRGGNDLIRGGSASDEISGGAGRDELFGDGGSDVIEGGSGGDLIFGGAGGDMLFGGNAGDIIDGGSGNDVINGEGFTDTLNGGDGDDTITGGGGTDTINGGADDDTIFGNNARDIIDGGTGNDILNGGRENDELRGGNGDDMILGSTGNDSLYGDSGADTFQFRANHGVDRIFDFQDGTDVIEFNINSVNDISDLTLTNVFSGVDIDYGTGTIRVIGLDDTDFSAADFVFL
jgi:T5SS/PEP-CTERM-associated repeat protein